MGYEINWHVNAGDAVLSSPQYQKWSRYTFADLVPVVPDIKNDVQAALAANESAAVVNYLCWLLRVVNLSA